MALPAILAGLASKKLVVFVASKGPGIALWKLLVGAAASVGIGTGVAMKKRKNK